MRISMDRLVFDGVGPFQNQEVFDLAGQGVTYVYAPNGHGKTSTIDLVRWLVQGRRAMDAKALRSLRQKQEKNVINHQRFREMGGGRVSAVLSVEGMGRYRATRRIPFGTDPSSVLTVEEEVDGAWTEVEDPEEFLADLLPHERLGFNLLTGEHVQAFVEELSGPAVKASMERLLRDPELVRVHEAVSSITAELEKEAAREDRAQKRHVRLLGKRKELIERKKNLDAKALDLENQEATLQNEIETLNQELATLEEVPDLQRQRDEHAEAIATLEERRTRELATLKELVTPSWRGVLRAAGSDAVTALLGTHEAAVQDQEDWQRSLGERDHLQRLLETDTCSCGEPLGKETRTRFEARIKDLQDARPEVPDLPAEPWTLRRWAEGEPVQTLVEHLGTHRARLADLDQDLRDQRAQLHAVEERLEEADPDAAKRLERRLKSRKMKVRALRDERSDYVGRAIDANKELNEVKQALKKNTPDTVDGALLRKARAYTDAFREAIDRALPELQDALNDRTQEIFDELFQKESDYEVTLSPNSCVPRVIRTIDGEEEDVLLSEGEKTRLGLALLFALREVASERPFLLLDAPFSTLDDEGIHRLLELIGNHDGQVVVFTKNAFPAGRWYDAVKSADPVVYQMDWVKDGPNDREGHTELSLAKTNVLCIQEA